MKRNPKKKFKKSQIEIMGLAIIVVLVAIGTYLFFTLSSHIPKHTPKNYIDDKLAQSYLLALLDTQIDCGGIPYSIQEFIVDCNKEKRIICNGFTSCQQINKTIELILNKTFLVWNTKYRINIENPHYTYSYKCNRTSIQGITSNQPIPIGGGISTRIELAICK
ncbi:MAG: hypothetical protein QXG00_00310 [Candidatus Woesearchaeota archaeon]